MSFFTIASLVIAGVVFLLTLLFQEIYYHYSPDSTPSSEDDKKHLAIQMRLKKIACSLLFAILGLFVTKVIEIYNNTVELAITGKQILKASTYATALERLETLKTSSPLHCYLEEELLSYQEKFKQIEALDIELKREDVIPCWELLIEKSQEHVDATNIVSLDDWETFSPSAGKDAHLRALSNKVKIRRILIYNGSDAKSKKALIEQAAAQEKWDTLNQKNIEVRLLDGKWFQESPFVSNYLRDLGTQDIVIVDREMVLLTNTDDNRSIISAKLTCNNQKLKTAEKLYEKLWRAAEKPDNMTK